MLYFVEHVARELDIACILRHLLATRYDINIHVASIHFDLHSALCKMRPRLVITPFFYFASDANLQYLLAGAAGARLVNLAFEQLLSRGNRAFKRPQDAVVRHHVLHLASGPAFRDFLCEHGVLPSNVRIVGSLPLGLYRTPYRRHADGRRRALAQRFGLSEDQPWIFFPENYSAAFLSDRDIEFRIRQGFDRGDAYDYRRFARRSFATVMPWCWQAARQGTAELILRPRPATARAALLGACREVTGAAPPPNLHCIKEGSVREWNLASDIVLSSYSSTVVEAAVAGKPAYLLVPERFPEYMHSDWLDHAPQLTSADDLMALVRDPGRAQPAVALADWAATQLAGHDDPFAVAAEVISHAYWGRAPAPPRPPGRSWSATISRRIRCHVRALTSRRRQGHYQYEHDHFDAATVGQTTAQWAALLDDRGPVSAAAGPHPQLANDAPAGPDPSGSGPATAGPGVRFLPSAGRAIRSLKVAFVVSARLWGGGESQVALLADGLRLRGHRCRFFARRASLCADQLRNEGFLVDTFLGTGRDPVSVWKVRRHLYQWQPDVLHLNDSHAITCGGLAAQGLGIPARIAARRSIFPIRSGHRYRRYADRVICVAQAVAERCGQAGIPDDSIRIVYDGTPAVAYPTPIRRQVRSELQIADHQPVLLTVAWLHASKGHRYLLAALAEVVARFPQTILLLAGAGSEQEALQHQAAAQGLGEHVRFLGFRTDVGQLIQAADLFVMPSLSEGLCSSLIDAMRGGCPIVTTTVGGIAELIGTGDLGSAPLAWTVPERNPAALAAAIVAALADPHERATRATRAKQRALVQFTVDQMVEGTLQVYHELLEAGSSPTHDQSSSIR
ncbi:MAG: hypothetical protein A2W31_13175 [Planctomycetes bacterium RBG_16_64_10]|nr:MAG: hypothetical protein A2W31_13175 [Planctomycetes bacterium RBG_16_64_10]